MKCAAGAALFAAMTRDAVLTFRRRKIVIMTATRSPPLCVLHLAHLTVPIRFTHKVRRVRRRNHQFVPPQVAMVLRRAFRLRLLVLLLSLLLLVGRRILLNDMYACRLQHGVTPVQLLKLESARGRRTR